MEQNINPVGNIQELDNQNLPNSIADEQRKQPSVLLQRLLEEVKFENENNISAYNRTHNRHNRGR
jgi:hypothetical protein